MSKYTLNAAECNVETLNNGWFSFTSIEAVDSTITRYTNVTLLCDVGNFKVGQKFCLALLDTCMFQVQFILNDGDTEGPEFSLSIK